MREVISMDSRTFIGTGLVAPYTESVKSAGLIEFGSIGNADFGFLTAAEGNANVPFDIKRVYWTYLAPTDIVRGNHAHKVLEQVIFAVSGQIEVELEDSRGRKLVYQLDSPSTGLFIPQLHWRTLKFLKNAVLLSLASLPYDENEYIRDYNEFQKICAFDNPHV